MTEPWADTAAASPCFTQLKRFRARVRVRVRIKDQGLRVRVRVMVRVGVRVSNRTTNPSLLSIHIYISLWANHDRRQDCLLFAFLVGRDRVRVTVRVTVRVG